ncbi:hypothetical protein [Bacillus sp. MUM 116]|nr:hypothetical protein [Bacillus sp. MUM 116]
MWVRLLIVGFFSLSALSLVSFQSIEIVHAVINFLQDKNQIK